MFISWGGRTCRRRWREVTLASKEAVLRSRLPGNKPLASDLPGCAGLQALPFYQDAAEQDRSGFEGSVKVDATRSSEIGH